MAASNEFSSLWVSDRWGHWTQRRLLMKWIMKKPLIGQRTAGTTPSRSLSLIEFISADRIHCGCQGRGSLN
jgi:hypothetical protein